MAAYLRGESRRHQEPRSHLSWPDATLAVVGRGDSMRTRLLPQSFALLVAAAVAVTACGQKKASGANAVKVTNIDLGRSLKPGLPISDMTNTFQPNDEVIAIVMTKS